MNTKYFVILYEITTITLKVLIIYAHPNRMSFTHAVLENFVKGIREAGHQYEIVDLYKIKFNPVFQDMDSAFFVDESLPKDLFQQMGDGSTRLFKNS